MIIEINGRDRMDIFLIIFCFFQLSVALVAYFTAKKGDEKIIPAFVVFLSLVFLVFVLFFTFLNFGRR